MALIGPTPTVAHVSSLVRSHEGSELFEIFDEVIQFTDGPILTNLAANQATRSKLASFLTIEKLNLVFPELQNTSDPEFIALGWLADECDTLRSRIVELATEPEAVKQSLNVISRLLSAGKLNTATLNDSYITKCLEWTSGPLDHWQGLATIVSKACSVDHSKAVLQFIEQNKNTDLGYSAANACFDVLPAVKDIVWTMEPSTESRFFVLLSSLCNDKDDRLKVAAHFQKAVEESDTDEAKVVLAKLLVGSTSQTVKSIADSEKQLDTLSKTFESNINEVTLEGLACTANLPSVRARAAQSVDLVKSLAELVKREPARTSFAATAVLRELSWFPKRRSEAQTKQLKLRQHALGESVFDSGNDKLQTEEGLLQAREVSVGVCDNIIASGILNWYTLNGLKLSVNTREQLAYLLLELTAHQKRSRRHSLALQGAAVTAMYIWTEKRPTIVSDGARVAAAASVARILMTVETKVALTGKVGIPQTIPVLSYLLTPNQKVEESELYAFESLRALTNLASIDERPLRVSICRNVWPQLGELLQSDTLLVKRSALELTCNLMLVPQSAQHFLQSNAQSRGLLTVLGQSILCEDRDSRLASTAALAILAEWETAAERIGRNTECIEGLSRAMGLYPDDDDMLVRTLTALKVILKATTADLDDEVAERIIFFEGLAHLEELVDTLNPAAHREVAKLVLQCIQLLAQYKVKG